MKVQCPTRNTSVNNGPTFFNDMVLGILYAIWKVINTTFKQINSLIYHL